VQVTRLVHDFYDTDPKRGFYGGGGIDVRLPFAPIQYALNVGESGAPRWGPDFKRRLHDEFTRVMVVAVTRPRCRSRATTSRSTRRPGTSSACRVSE
jgi:hypothetical protein